MVTIFFFSCLQGPLPCCLLQISCGSYLKARAFEASMYPFRMEEDAYLLPYLYIILIILDPMNPLTAVIDLVCPALPRVAQRSIAVRL